ncbi:hypothetical protein O181_001991 [Austropuccinia psidii MF-1]|uniref:Uncharacterized protein n=1 Tax=Austropuccinia psidii MF-1 TaxID=1389203 RepID=A0A9Q3BC64_9BASI|nr:hypothetical protein [Austropuccinia psidii MF-1]
MSRLCQDNVNPHMCHMIMSLKAQTHFNTICKVQVITPHGARQKFGILIFVHEKTSSPPPDHLTPLTCLLSHLNWLPHPSLILPDPQHAYVHSPPSRCDSDTAPSSPPSPLLTLPHPATYHPYAHVVPCRHASDATYQPYAHIVPSQHSSNGAYHP